jgi:hypothetical protein
MGQKAEKNIPDKWCPTANQKRDFSANVTFLVYKGTSQLSKVSPKTALRGLNLGPRTYSSHLFCKDIVQ